MLCADPKGPSVTMGVYLVSTRSAMSAFPGSGASALDQVDSCDVEQYDSPDLSQLSYSIERLEATGNKIGKGFLWDGMRKAFAYSVSEIFHCGV